MVSISGALGIGSGIDIAALVADLANASRAPREAAIAKREQANTAQVSTLASLKNALDSFATSLETLSSGGSLSTQPVVSDAAVLGASASRGASLDGFSGQIEVVRLATAQSMVSGGIADAGAPIGQGDLTLTVGGVAHTITIGAANDSLSGLAAAINAAGKGVTATILRDGGMSKLVLRGPSGAAGAFSLSGGPAMTQVQAAGDAELTIDGVGITRASNRIDDLFAGVTIDLKKTGSVTLSTERPTAALKQAVYDFASAYNQLESALDNAGASGLEGTPGPLRGSSALRDMRAQLAALVATRLSTGDGPQSLGEIGLKTGRDGSLSVDATLLDSAIASHPQSVERLFSPAIAVNSTLVRVTSVAGAVKPGTYTITDLVPASGSTPASGKINGVAATANGSILSVSTGPAAGLSFEVLGSVSSATVTVDSGLAGAMAKIRDLLNAEKGSFTTTSDRLTAEAKSLAKEREKMELTADAYEARLKASFTAMETRVTAMKATQAYLQQQIDMWTNADD